MNLPARRFPLPVLAWLCLAAPAARGATPEIPSPETYFGHPMGADRKLIHVDEFLPYYERVAGASDRVELVRLGKTMGGRDLVLLVISTPENLARQARYREIAARLDDPRGLSPEEIDALVAEGKVILLVTLNIHSSEIAVSQMGMEWVYELATGGPDSPARFLEDVIVLFVPTMNPDGQALVTEWYRKVLGTPYEGSDLPRLYHPYAGHDNNRDWFMLNLPETRMLNRVAYHEWHPQVLLDEHQMGETGPRAFVPPYADPISDKVHPLIHRGALLIGAGMAMDLEQAGKAGVIYGYSFDAYWPGGTRSTPWWKNTVGILTEIASARVMTPIHVDPGELTGGRKGLPEYQAQVNFPNPWPGGWWHPRDIVDYARILTGSALETCALHRDDFLRNRAIMAQDAVRRGETEAPYGFVLPPLQHDPGTTAKLVDLLIENGIRVHRASRDLTAGEQAVPAGSFVVLTSQPFRSFVVEMMEPQTYPEIKADVNSTEILSPYDVTAWSLPYMMGVQSHRLESPVDGLLDRVAPPAWSAPALADVKEAIWALSPRENDAYTAVMRLLTRGNQVQQAVAGQGAGAGAGSPLPSGWRPDPGTFLVRARRDEIAAALAGLCAKAELMEEPLRSRSGPTPPPAEGLLAFPCRFLRTPRVGIYQSWLASIDEGWTRFVLDDFEFPYTVLHDHELQAGNLRRSFDAILLPDLTRKEIVEGKSENEGNGGAVPLPPPYTGGLGEKGVRALEEFVRAGGTLITLGNASELAIQDLRVPVTNTVEKMSRRDFDTPGTLLRVTVDTEHPLGYGMPEQAMVYHTTDPVLGTQVPGPGMSRSVVARYVEGETLVASGWARGSALLERKAALVESSLGEGRVVLFGFRPQYRGQTHGTYRLLFNALLDAAAR